MSYTAEQPRRVTPAKLGFLSIYNPSLGTTDDTIKDQIVYYSSTQEPSKQQGQTDAKSKDNATREESNEQLRQIGLAQAMVEFGSSFSAGKSVDTIETEKSRIILHELESGWWILASIDLTRLPSAITTQNAKGKVPENQDKIEYSSREVKPAILLLGDLLRAHSTFLLHHASSLSALFVRAKRSKFIRIIGRYWNAFLSTWNVLMHGNPATSLYGGIKIAACGELGVGVGEEERGSGEREVLEGFIGRIDGLVDVIVSKFGDGELTTGDQNAASKSPKGEPTVRLGSPWLGSGDEPAVEDGVIFLGNGALSRKSLRDVSHWVEDLYRWGWHAYGVVDNPSSNRRAKTRSNPRAEKKEISPDAKKKARQVYGLSIGDKGPRSKSPLRHTDILEPVEGVQPHNQTESGGRRPSLNLGHPSHTSTDSESSKTNKFITYLKLGYGTHWSLSAASSNNKGIASEQLVDTPDSGAFWEASVDRPPEILMHLQNDSVGHYLIGLVGDIENEDDMEVEDRSPESHIKCAIKKEDGYNARLLLRTLTVELERAEDARPEADISIDLGSTDNDRVSSTHGGSEHTGTSNASFESQDRNKTKKLRVVVYVSKPFIFVFLFELRTHALELTSLYRSLHYQIGPLIKPLLSSTRFRSKPDISTTASTEDASCPIYDLVWDPRLLVVNSTIPNIPDPFQSHPTLPALLPWSRIEALNTHMQIINTYISTTTDRTELERTCKTSRGWWVIWTRIPDAGDSKTASLSSGRVKVPHVIEEDRAESLAPQGYGTSRGTSTMSWSRSMGSGPAHPFLETHTLGIETPKDKEIFLVRRASDYGGTRLGGRFTSGSSSGTGVDGGAGKLGQGIGVDTKRYIEALLDLPR